MPWEDENLDAYKREDYYHFTVPFEYIKKNYGNGEYDIDSVEMEVDVEWNSTEKGYVITYDVPEKDKIDPAEGNGDMDEFYDVAVSPIVLHKLAMLGIEAEALVWGTGVM